MCKVPSRGGFNVHSFCLVKFFSLRNIFSIHLAILECRFASCRFSVSLDGIFFRVSWRRFSLIPPIDIEFIIFTIWKTCRKREVCSLPSTRWSISNQRKGGLHHAVGTGWTLIIPTRRICLSSLKRLIFTFDFDIFFLFSEGFRASCLLIWMFFLKLKVVCLINIVTCESDKVPLYKARSRVWTITRKAAKSLNPERARVIANQSERMIKRGRCRDLCRQVFGSKIPRWALRSANDKFRIGISKIILRNISQSSSSRDFTLRSRKKTYRNELSSFKQTQRNVARMLVYNTDMSGADGVELKKWRKKISLCMVTSLLLCGCVNWMGSQSNWQLKFIGKQTKFRKKIFIWTARSCENTT